MLKFTNLLLASLVCAFAAAGSSWAAQGYVYETQGNVTAALAGAPALPVQQNQGVGDNTVVTVGPGSSVTLKFLDGTVVLLNENTTFQVQRYTYSEKEPGRMSALFELVRGGMRAVTGVMASRNRNAFKVATPLATIGIRGTEFMAQLVNPLYTQVVTGAVDLSNAAGVRTFGAGQFASVLTSTTLPSSIPSVPPGTFGNMPAVKLPPPKPGPVPPPPARKASVEQVKAQLKAPGDLASKVKALADQGVSPGLIVAAVGEVEGTTGVLTAVSALIGNGADAATVAKAAVAAGVSPGLVQSTAIAAGADPATVTAATAAGLAPGAGAGTAGFIGTTPGTGPTPGGGGGGAGGVPVSPN